MPNECVPSGLPGIVSLFSLTRIISSSMIKFKDYHGFSRSPLVMFVLILSVIQSRMRH